MGRRKTQYDPQAIAYAVAEVAKGRSLRDVAAELCELGEPVSHNQVGQWVKGGAELVASALAADAPDGLPPTPPKIGRLPPAPAVSSALTERLRAQKDRQVGSAETTPEASAEDPDAPFDFEASLQRMIREAEREAKAHDLQSNPRGAQAAMRRASEMMKVLAQSEKRKPTDPDVLTFSKAEIEQAFGDVSDLLAKLCERPVLCSECSRALSIKFGRGEG